MIFPSLSFENVLQVDDKTRLNASKSFVTAGETVTNVEIQPESGESFYSVYNSDDDKWFLDWAYETEGIKTITVRVTTDVSTKDKTYQTNVLTEDEDALLSDDSCLYPYEPEIHRILPKGKNSFKYAHRAAQDKIIAYLDEQRIYKNDNSRYTKHDLVTITDPEFKYQFKQWSTFQTLLIIFESNQIAVGDVFEEKRQQYENEMRQHRNRASLRLDQDGDGVIDELPYNIRSTMMVRR
jgi:hypothetical protein